MANKGLNNFVTSFFNSQIQNETPLPAYKVGKVFGVLLNENTPNKEAFKSKGGWGSLGGIWFKKYIASKSEENEKVNLDECEFALPIFPNQKIFPVIGELVLLFNLPSANTQENNVSNNWYYISIISLWNSVQNNAQAPTEDSILGKTFFERPNVRPLQPYEGDIIYEGRDGNALRLGGTARDVNRPNPWSTTGGENDPIVILGNGYNFSSSLEPYIEDINKDKASIYLTSTQTIPLKTEVKANPIANPIDVSKYSSGGQFIATADRIVLSSKSDAVLIHGKTNVGLYSPSRITIDANKSFIVNSPKVILGLNKGTIPTEPVLLGNKTVEVISSLVTSLNSFSTAISSAISTPRGTPSTEINQAAISLSQSLVAILKQIESTKSTTTFVAS